MCCIKFFNFFYINNGYVFDDKLCDSVIAIDSEVICAVIGEHDFNFTCIVSVDDSCSNVYSFQR